MRWDINNKYKIMHKLIEIAPSFTENIPGSP